MRICVYGLGAIGGLLAGRLARAGALAPQRALGSVVHLSAACTGPGVVRAVAGSRIVIGEPTGGASTARARAVLDALASAGFDVEGVPSIQQEIWFKLWGNMTVNPVSALTGATGDRILDDDHVRGFMTRCMQEAAQIGERIGLPIATSPEERHAVTRKLGAFRTSMLQDVEAGKPVELDALFGLAHLHARVRGLYPG